MFAFEIYSVVALVIKLPIPINPYVKTKVGKKTVNKNPISSKKFIVNPLAIHATEIILKVEKSKLNSTFFPKLVLFERKFEK